MYKCHVPRVVMLCARLSQSGSSQRSETKNGTERRESGVAVAVFARLQRINVYHCNNNNRQLSRAPECFAPTLYASACDFYTFSTIYDYVTIRQSYMAYQTTWMRASATTFKQHVVVVGRRIMNTTERIKNTHYKYECTGDRHTTGQP